MVKVELVFRTIGERTTDIALQLAKQNLRPDRVHVLENITPFSQAVDQQLKIQYDCDYVVFMDADCLIMEEMRNYIEKLRLPYVDCFLYDKFRGKLHTGVHITRIDLVREMARIVPPVDELKYILRPESGIRFYALENLNLGKAFKNFRIYHDFHQYYHDIFSKYSLRELRSRTDQNRSKLSVKMENWDREDTDYRVAQKAIEYTREKISHTTPPLAIRDFINRLPQIAQTEIAALGLTEKPPLTQKEVMATVAREEQHSQGYIFGVGLSQTGGKHLFKALGYLGYTVLNEVADETLYQDLKQEPVKLSALSYFDGITNPSIATFYEKLDKAYPGSRFILTLRNKEEWLENVKGIWRKKLSRIEEEGLDYRYKYKKQEFHALYQLPGYEKQKLVDFYDRHCQKVLEYFRNREQDLLVLDLSAGDGWQKLCSFLDKPVLRVPFPSWKKK